MLASSILALSLAVPEAEAANVPKIKNVRIRETPETGTGGVTYRVMVATGLGTIGWSHVALIHSNGSFRLSQADAWLHGAATFTKLPSIDGTVGVILYDSAGTKLGTMSGALSAAGELELAVDASTGDCTTRAGCSDATALDLEAIDAAVYPSPTGGYDLGFTLAGADTYEVAYAKLALTASDEVTTCDKSGGCSTTGSTVTYSAEVGWDELGEIWEAEIDVPEDAVFDAEVALYEDDKKVETAKVELALPFGDGDGGVSAVPAEDDPLTVIALSNGPFVKRVDKSTPVLSVVSDGWSLDDALPTHAELALDDGHTITIPANSYQVATSLIPGSIGMVVNTTIAMPLSIELVGAGTILTYDNINFYGDSSDLVCDAGVCGQLSWVDGELAVSITVFSDEPADLPRVAAVELKHNGHTLQVEAAFDTFVAVVFGSAIEFAEDPTGLGLTGTLSLLGEADSKGKQDTLSKGKFVASVDSDGNGGVGLASADKNTIQARGDILIGNEPFEFEKTDDNGDGWLTPPPVIVLMTTGNGTRSKVINVQGGTDTTVTVWPS